MLNEFWFILPKILLLCESKAKQSLLLHVLDCIPGRTHPDSRGVTVRKGTWMGSSNTKTVVLTSLGYYVTTYRWWSSHFLVWMAGGIRLP